MATIATDALLLLLRLNLVAAGAVSLVLLFRPLVRRCFGQHQVYLTWLLVPVSMIGAIIPAPEGSGPVRPVEAAIGDAHGWLAAGEHRWGLIGVWAAGVAVCLAVAAARYARFNALV